MREKLIELLKRFDAYCVTDLECKSCSAKHEDNCWACGRADYLIANGVTVQKWISVKDRLPNRDDVVIAFYPTMRGTSGEMQIHKAWAMSETCTHWMPLPEPPQK